MELKFDQNQKEVTMISKMFREWQETLQGPTQA
jgi:hypothetical protein